MECTCALPSVPFWHEQRRLLLFLCSDTKNHNESWRFTLELGYRMCPSGKRQLRRKMPMEVSEPVCVTQTPTFAVSLHETQNVLVRRWRCC